MAWQDSLATHLWIFSVGRGNAAFIRTGLNQGFILDMNASDLPVGDTKFPSDPEDASDGSVMNALAFPGMRADYKEIQ